MRVGFDFFKSRKANVIIPDFQSVALKYDIVLPPIFKLFLENFEFNQIRHTADSPYCIYYQPIENVGLTDIGNADFEDMIAAASQQDDQYTELKFIGIGGSGIHAGGICVGTIGEYVDKIYVDTDYYDQRFMEVSENIFEFIRGIKEYDRRENIPLFYYKELLDE